MKVIDQSTPIYFAVTDFVNCQFDLNLEDIRFKISTTSNITSEITFTVFDIYETVDIPTKKSTYGRYLINNHFCWSRWKKHVWRLCYIKYQQLNDRILSYLDRLWRHLAYHCPWRIRFCRTLWWCSFTNRLTWYGTKYNGKLVWQINPCQPLCTPKRKTNTVFIGS